MKKLTLCALALFPSCSLLEDNFTDVAKLPRNDVAKVGTAIQAALATPDLDLDGTVNGFAEWEAFVRTLVQTYQSQPAK